jgi:hypothetical protein
MAGARALGAGSKSSDEPSAADTDNQNIDSQSLEGREVE